MAATQRSGREKNASRPPQPNRGRFVRCKRPGVASYGFVAAGPLSTEDTGHLRPSAGITHLAEPPPCCLCLSPHLELRAVLLNRIEADVHDSNAPELPLMVLVLLGPSAGKMPLI